MSAVSKVRACPFRMSDPRVRLSATDKRDAACKRRVEALSVVTVPSPRSSAPDKSTMVPIKSSKASSPSVAPWAKFRMPPLELRCPLLRFKEEVSVRSAPWVAIPEDALSKETAPEMVRSVVSEASVSVWFSKMTLPTVKGELRVSVTLSVRCKEVLSLITTPSSPRFVPNRTGFPAPDTSRLPPSACRVGTPPCVVKLSVIATS